MMKKKWLALIVLVAMMLPSSAFAQVTANEAGSLSNEALEFLQEHHVDDSLIDQMMATPYGLNDEAVEGITFNDSIISLKAQTSAYDFSDNQIQAYVRGLVDTPTVLVTDDMMAPRAIDRPMDDGIGYEVQTYPGFTGASAFAVLPTVSETIYTSAYMMYTVASSNFAVDLGLYYEDGDGGPCWRGLVMYGGNILKETSDPVGLYPGDEVYFDLEMVGAYARIRILDADNFSRVYFDYTIYISNASTAVFNRQITLTDSRKNYNDRTSYLHDAEFYDGNVYKNNTAYLVTASNTDPDRVGVFGTNSSNRGKVSVIAYSPWYTERVSIDFR